MKMHTTHTPKVTMLVQIAFGIALALFLVACSSNSSNVLVVPDTSSSSSAAQAAGGAANIADTPSPAANDSANSGTSSSEATDTNAVSEPAEESSGASSESASANTAKSEAAAAAVRALPAGSVVDEDMIATAGEDACFTVEEIDDETFARMYGLSFKEYCTVPREDLRYIRVLHKTAEGETLAGELVMNVSVAEKVCDIFHELYRANYPIHKMHLVDDYGADDDASMEDDNTSAFNYRLVAGTDQLSKHALGTAIDINPYYNPYCIPTQDYVSPASAYQYGQRDSGTWPYKIEEGDLCHRLFVEAGFFWGGYWEETKDYQHFEIPE